MSGFFCSDCKALIVMRDGRYVCTDGCKNSFSNGEAHPEEIVDAIEAEQKFDA